MLALEEQWCVPRFSVWPNEKQKQKSVIDQVIETSPSARASAVE
jgi:hypothetical protein